MKKVFILIMALTTATIEAKANEVFECQVMVDNALLQVIVNPSIPSTITELITHISEQNHLHLNA